MNVLVIGQGSIGKKHVLTLKELGFSTFTLSYHEKNYQTLKDFLATHPIDYVVVANSTHLHLKTLLELCECHFKGKILCEKPLHLKPLTDKEFNLLSKLSLFVGYQLRHHPYLLELKNKLAHEKVLCFNQVVGQFLPTWRKNRPYQESYSAKKEEGGGVLRDLSHELDILLWLFGNVKNVKTHGGHLSSLKINTEDMVQCLIEFESGVLGCLELNYLSKNPVRNLRIETEENTHEVNLLSNTERLLFNLHQSILTDKNNFACTLPDSQNVLKLIDTIENRKELYGS